MNGTNERKRRERAASSRSWRFPTALASAALLLLAAGCENPLDVKNPNNVAAEDLQQARSVRPVVNGALSATARGVADIGAAYSAASDELTWIGSRNAWGALDLGAIGDPTNEFSNGAWPEMGTARFMVDRALAQAQEFQGEVDIELVVRAALYRGILYTYVANIYDNFVIPDSPEEAAPALGSSSMAQLYDQAVQSLTTGLELARQNGLRDRVTQLLAVRAWTQYSKAIWQKLNPPGSTPSDPLVNPQEAVQDARAVLQRVGPQTDWKYEFQYTRNSVSSNVAFQVNERQELQFEQDLVTLDPEDPGTVISVDVEDPIEDVVDPVLRSTINRFNAGGDLADLTVVSARLMNLIVAEAELAQGDDQGFATYVNNVRAMDELTPWDASDPQVPAMDLLQHELFVNKFLQVKRLADMYRFGIESINWQPASPAATRPGTFFPIANIEIQSNPQISG